MVQEEILVAYLFPQLKMVVIRKVFCIVFLLTNMTQFSLFLKSALTLNITGKPCLLQKSLASSLVVIGPSVPGTIGTPVKDSEVEY